MARVSPFHAKTEEVIALAMAAAVWFCMLKKLQQHQRNLAPMACIVSMRTPVWMVTCKEPLMFNPAKSLTGALLQVNAQAVTTCKVATKSAAILELLAGKDQALLIKRIPSLSWTFDIVNGIAGLYVQKSLAKDHHPSQAGAL